MKEAQEETCWTISVIEATYTSNQWHDKQARLRGDDLRWYTMVRRRWILLQALGYGAFLRRGIENFDYILRDCAAEWPRGVVETSELKKRILVMSRVRHATVQATSMSSVRGNQTDWFYSLMELDIPCE